MVKFELRVLSMFNFLKKIKDGADEFYYTVQLDSFFAWLKEKTFSDKEIVFVNLPSQREFIFGKTRKTARTKKDYPIGFIVCLDQELLIALEILRQENVITTKDSWHRIAYVSGIEIWENRCRHTGNQVPIRLGLSDRQKLFLLTYARRSMESFFLDTPNHNTVRPNTAEIIESTENVSVDVCIWVKGELRGSIIVTEKPIYEAIHIASTRALRDIRMKPIEQRELLDVQVEISIFSDLKIPLSKRDIKTSYAEARRGYFVSHGDRQGWYVPTVFNCLKFTSMAHLQESLVKQKAKIGTSVDTIPMYTFSVESFIESSQHTVLNIQKPTLFNEIKESDFKEAIKTHGDMAAHWLCRIQDVDGYMPLYVDPLYRKFGRIDWVRLSCVTQALAEYGCVQKNQSFLNASNKSFEYLLRNILEINSFSVNMRIGTLVYLARTAIALNKEIEYKNILTYIDSHWRGMSYRPIILATVASLFATEGIQNDRLFLKESINIAENVFTEFERLKVSKNTESARYPELVFTFRLLYEATGDETFIKNAEMVEKWLIMRQLEDGSFCARGNTIFSYSRGTGKIFEVLAVSPERHMESVRRAFFWLISMQYNEENLYFTNQDFKSNVIGSLRHDYANTEAWIDGAGHFLLGCARLLRGMNLAITRKDI